MNLRTARYFGGGKTNAALKGRFNTQTIWQICDSLDLTFHGVEYTNIPVPAPKLMGNRYSRVCCHLSKAVWTQPRAVHARNKVHVSSFMWTHTHWDDGMDPPDQRTTQDIPAFHCECKLPSWTCCHIRHTQHSLRKYLLTLAAAMLLLMQLSF